MVKKKTNTHKELLEKEIHLPEFKPDPNGESIALVFPNNYKIGMSSLAYLTVYRHLIEDGFRPERYFLDICNSRRMPVSIEKGTALKNFKKIAFHFSYELDYINAVRMLIAAGIDHNKKSRRKHKGAYLIAGGICPTINPLPLTEFFDAAYIGELERGTLNILHGSGLADRLLDAGAGWLVFDDSTVDIAEIFIKQHISPDWRDYSSFSPIITPNAIFGMMNLIEISRGCPVKCKFCITGNLHPNVREKRADLIIDSALLLRDITNRVGLIGAIPSTHSGIIKILTELINLKFKPSLSSLSVTSVNHELLELLVKGGMKSLTLGVESFDYEVQKSVGKVITPRRLGECLQMAFGLGMNRIKLYLMLGLPGADSDEENLIIDEVTNLHKLAQKQKPGSRITISLNPFIPKIATLYSRERFMGEKPFRQKMAEIRKKLTKIGVKVKSESHRDSLIQYLLSCGDESMSVIIEMLAKNKNFSEIRKSLKHDPETYVSSSIEKVEKKILR